MPFVYVIILYSFVSIVICVSKKKKKVVDAFANERKEREKNYVPRLLL